MWSEACRTRATSPRSFVGDVAGGLIKDTDSDIETGIPLLSRIPVLGALFGSTDTFTKRTELLVLITPRVVGSLQDARDVTEELRRRMRAVIPLRRRIE